MTESVTSARVRGALARRFSNAAGPHSTRRTRSAELAAALADWDEDADGITDDDRARAALGARMKADYPGAVTDPAVVAEIRRDMAATRTRLATRPRWAVAFSAYWAEA